MAATRLFSTFIRNPASSLLILPPEIRCLCSGFLPCLGVKSPWFFGKVALTTDFNPESGPSSTPVFKPAGYRDSSCVETALRTVKSVIRAKQTGYRGSSRGRWWRGDLEGAYGYLQSLRDCVPWLARPDTRASSRVRTHSLRVFVVFLSGLPA